MARIRSIKPEMWSHPVLGRLDDATRLMAAALLNHADDEGYFFADPAVVRNACRPFDDDSRRTQGALTELIRIGWIEVVLHETHGEIGRVVKFCQHQVINRPTPSKIKKYFLPDSSVSDPGSLLAGKEGKGTGKGKEKTLAPAAPPKPPKVVSLEVIKTVGAQEAFRRIWALWPAKRTDGGRAKGHPVEAERAFQKILDSGAATFDELEQAAGLYLTQHPNVAQGYIVNVSTYFGSTKGLWLEGVRWLRANPQAVQA